MNHHWHIGNFSGHVVRLSWSPCPWNFKLACWIRIMHVLNESARCLDMSSQYMRPDFAGNDMALDNFPEEYNKLHINFRIKSMHIYNIVYPNYYTFAINTFSQSPVNKPFQSKTIKHGKRIPCGNAYSQVWNECESNKLLHVPLSRLSCPQMIKHAFCVMLCLVLVIYCCALLWLDSG